MLVFYCPYFTPTQCLFSIDHGLHPRIFISRTSRPFIACFPEITLLILFSARCICQLHPPGSSLVKAIFYIMSILESQTLVLPSVEIWEQIFHGFNPLFLNFIRFQKLGSVLSTVLLIKFYTLKFHLLMCLPSYHLSTHSIKLRRVVENNSTINT